MIHHTILETIWYLLPAIAANMAPVLVTHFNILPALSAPLDANATWRGRRIFGDNKTVRGLIIGLIIGSIVGLLQGSTTAGALLGLGALLGDAVGSVIKRQLNIAPGRRWMPFDQIDFVFGALLLGGWLLPLTITHIITAILVLGFGSYLTSWLGVKLKIKKSL
jgi:CDP-2,3-bis-(O-geranylgeranyl)-sn-glycerol synthase